MVEALGTIARSGTQAFMERIEAAHGDDEGAQLIGQFGVGFYSAFMVADRVDVVSRRAGSDEAALWSSDGKGTYSIAPADAAEAPARGTRVDAPSDGGREDLHRALHGRAHRQGAVRPCAGADRARREAGRGAEQIADGAALWTKPKADITAEDYTDFYRSLAGQFDEPALTVHFRAEGRHEYTVLAFVPGLKPFDLFDPDRKGRMKLYVRRVFITDEAELLPRYLRFVRGLVDSADLPLNVSREMIQESPILAAIRKGVDQPRPDRTREARRERRRGLREALGDVRRGAQGRHLRGLRTPRRSCSASRASGPRRRATAGASLKDYVEA